VPDKKWVVNASPLISLAAIHMESVLFALADQIAIPDAVAKEVLAGKRHDPAYLLVEANKIPVLESQTIPTEIAAWDLGTGESAVLAYAYTHPGWIAILDDGMARKCAQSFSIPLKGTLSVVLLAKQAGLIPSAAQAIRELLGVGLRLQDSLIRDALKHTVGEDWDI
jgi:predicted nucleic acid-binding protein